MDPHDVFRPNPSCPATGQIGEKATSTSTHAVPSVTAAMSAGRPSGPARAPLRIGQALPRSDHRLGALTLVAYGRLPHSGDRSRLRLPKANRRTEQWVDAAGEHCERIHEHLVLKPRDLEHLQADELRVKTQGSMVWMALGVMVWTRLWLGGAISPSRDKALIRRLVAPIRACASRRREHPSLVATDGLITYVKAFGKAFGWKQYTGRVGAARLIAWPKVVIGQVIERYERRRVVGVERTVKRGSWSLLESLLDRTRGGGVLKTAYVERSNATFRARLAALVPRSRRGLARRHRRLHAAMYLVGTVYDFCRATTPA